MLIEIPPDQVNGQEPIKADKTKRDWKLLLPAASVIVSMILGACAPTAGAQQTEISPFAPGVATEQVPIDASPPEMSIETYPLSENYPVELKLFADTFAQLAEADNLPVEQVGAMQIFSAKQGEREVNYGLAPVTLAQGLTDEDGQYSGPNLSYYLAYEDETGVMVGSHVVGERIEIDKQGGTAFVYRMVDEATWNSLGGIETKSDNTLTLGQPIFIINLKDGINADRARELKASVKDGAVGPAEMLRENALGVAFIQPGIPGETVSKPINEAEATEKERILAWLDGFISAKPVQAIGLEDTATPVPVDEGTAAPTSTQTEVAYISIGPENFVGKYVEGVPLPTGREQRLAINQYLLAFGKEETSEAIATKMRFIGENNFGEALVDVNGDPAVVATYTREDGRRVWLMTAIKSAEGWTWGNANYRSVGDTVGVEFGSTIGDNTALDQMHTGIVLVDWGKRQKEQGAPL